MDHFIFWDDSFFENGFGFVFGKFNRVPKKFDIAFREVLAIANGFGFES